MIGSVPKDAVEEPFKKHGVLMAVLRKQTGRLGMRERLLGSDGENGISYFEGGKGPANLTISAGCHGPEIAGPWGIVKYLSSLDALPVGVRLTIIPTVSPTAFRQQSRTNKWGQATNAGYVVGTKERLSREGQLLSSAKDFLAERGKDGHLSLHEEFGLKDKFYIYTFEKGNLLADALRAVGLKYYAIPKDNTVPDRLESKKQAVGGVIKDDHDGSIEDMMWHLGARHSAVVETPQLSHLEGRINCQAEMIKAFIDVSCLKKFIDAK